MTKLPWPSGNFLLSPYYPRMRFLMPLNLSLSNAPEEVAPVYKYFEETYVLHVGKPVATRVKRRGIPAYHMQRHHPPRFSPKLWSVLHLQENNLPNTNNSLEAWHRRF